MALAFNCGLYCTKKVTMHIKNYYIITDFKYFTKFDIQKAMKTSEPKFATFHILIC